MENSASEFWRRFFSPRDEIRAHWYALVENVQFVAAEFYEKIEKELTARKVPGLEISRVEWSEGGPLSDKREYMRLRRERLVFDICAAPFGTSYFFSFRLVELPLGIKPVELIVFVVVMVIVYALLAKLLGTLWGVVVLFGILGGGAYLLRNSVALGVKDLDAKLMKIPVIGPLYEAFLRKETYYREDTRLMYLATVNDITERVVQEVLAGKGIKLLKQYERKPPMGDLYQLKTKRLDESNDTPTPAA